MNTGTLILSIIFITICALPFILSSRGSRKRKNILLKAVTEIAKKQNATISRYDVGADFIIAIDNVKNLVFFFKKTTDKPIENWIDLSDYHGCRVLKLGKNLNTQSTSHAIESLKLDFIPNDNKSAVQFEFYNEDVNTQLSGELQIINTWQELIQQKLVVI